MSKKPIIGIIGKYQGKWGEDIWNKVDVADEIRYLVVENDGIAISLLSTEKTLEFNKNDIKDEKEYELISYISNKNDDEIYLIYETDNQNDESVDAQGACIGAQGRRVQIICDEIGGEKIDIIRYSEDPATYIAASLSPSEVISVDVDPENKSAFVVVPDTQLSLAIGKAGQNARLAAKLTGWKIDIRSESAAKEEA